MKSIFIVHYTYCHISDVVAYDQEITMWPQHENAGLSMAQFWGYSVQKNYHNRKKGYIFLKYPIPSTLSIVKNTSDDTPLQQIPSDQRWPDIDPTFFSRDQYLIDNDPMVFAIWYNDDAMLPTRATSLIWRPLSLVQKSLLWAPAIMENMLAGLTLPGALDLQVT